MVSIVGSPQHIPIRTPFSFSPMGPQPLGAPRCDCRHMRLWPLLRHGTRWLDSERGILLRSTPTNTTSLSSKAHKASTLTRMAQQRHHDNLSQHTLDALCALLDCALGFFPCYFLFGCNRLDTTSLFTTAKAENGANPPMNRRMHLIYRNSDTSRVTAPRHRVT